MATDSMLKRSCTVAAANPAYRNPQMLLATSKDASARARDACACTGRHQAVSTHARAREREMRARAQGGTRLLPWHPYVKKRGFTMRCARVRGGPTTAEVLLVSEVAHGDDGVGHGGADVGAHHLALGAHKLKPKSFRI